MEKKKTALILLAVWLFLSAGAWYEENGEKNIFVADRGNTAGTVWKQLKHPAFNYNPNRNELILSANLIVLPNAELTIYSAVITLDSTEQEIGIYNFGRLVIANSRLRAKAGCKPPYEFQSRPGSELRLENNEIIGLGHWRHDHHPLVKSGLIINTNDAVIRGNNITGGCPNQPPERLPPGFERTHYGLIAFLKTDGALIENNVIENYQPYGSGIVLMGGPKDDSGGHVVIRDNFCRLYHAYHPRGSGRPSCLVIANRTGGGLIEGNDFETFGDGSVAIEFIGEAETRDYAIKENRIVSHQSFGLDLPPETNGFLIENNRFVVPGESRFSIGIIIFSANHRVVQNSFYGQGLGILISNRETPAGNEIKDNYFDVWGPAVLFHRYAHDNFIVGNTFMRRYYQVVSRGDARDNIFSSNHLYSSDSVMEARWVSNQWSLSPEQGGGNSWRDYSNQCPDSDCDGFCDQPYQVTETAYDYFPHTDDRRCSSKNKSAEQTSSAGCACRIGGQGYLLDFAFILFLFFVFALLHLSAIIALFKIITKPPV